MYPFPLLLYVEHMQYDEAHRGKGPPFEPFERGTCTKRSLHKLFFYRCSITKPVPFAVIAIKVIYGYSEVTVCIKRNFITTER